MDKDVSIKVRLLNIIVGFDQFMQTIVYLGKYNPDITISQVLGQKSQSNTMNFIEKSVCYILRKLQSRHCIINIETDESLYSKGN